MKNDYSDLRNIDFAPLSEVKAKLSEYMRRLGRRRIALTTNGRPSAVLMSYEDYMKLLGTAAATATEASADSPARRISLSDWRKEGRNLRSVRDSILGLFDAEKLSRKGQKSYKKRMVEIYRDGKSDKKTR